MKINKNKKKGGAYSSLIVHVSLPPLPPVLVSPLAASGGGGGARLATRAGVASRGIRGLGGSRLKHFRAEHGNCLKHFRAEPCHLQIMHVSVLLGKRAN